jgi:hypothetical protein
MAYLVSFNRPHRQARSIMPYLLQCGRVGIGTIISMDEVGGE